MPPRTNYAAPVTTIILACLMLGGAALGATPKGTSGPLEITPGRWTKPAGAKTAATMPQQVNTQGVLRSDGFEGSFPGTWTLANNDSANDPNWGTTTYRKYSGTRSVFCAQSGPNNGAYTHSYANNMASNWITCGPFNLSGVTEGRARFKLWLLTEKGYDWAQAGWSLDDSAYEGFLFSGDSNGWINIDIPLNHPGFSRNYAGASQVYFSFWFKSDATYTLEGAYVDDFSFTTGPVAMIQSLIKTSAGTAVSGVALTLSGSKLYDYTGTDGKAAVRPAPGTYTVTPKKPGYVFTPASRTVTLGASTVNANFTATVATGDGVVRYWGLCVGIEQYKNINNLSYCVDDAVDMRNALIACGWTAGSIGLLKDTQATKAGIKAALDAKIALADADDVFVFFHSGHGDQNFDMPPLDELDGYDEYLCTHDTAASGTTTEISDDELGLWFSKLKTKKYMVLIDTCHSGGMIRSASTFDFGPDITHGGSNGQLSTQDLHHNGAGVVITASDQDELSEEQHSLQNGVFAYYVVQGINNGKADTNRDKWFSAEELYAYAAPRTHVANPDQTVTKYDGYYGSLNFAKVQTLMKTTVPARNATGVSRTANLTITFRYPVNQASAQSHFSLRTPSNSAIAGTFTWTTANRVMVFNPSVTLAPNSQYTAWILMGLQSLAGTTYWYNDNFKFTTTGSTTAALVVQAAAAPTPGGLTQITVTLNSAATVATQILNLAGRTVAILPSQELENGSNTLLWDGKSTLGSRVPAGQYLVRLQATDRDGNAASCLVTLNK